MVDSHLKPYSSTNIKYLVPLIVDLNQLNYDAWRVLFETHCKTYDVSGHVDDTSNPKDDKDVACHNLDSLVSM